MQSRNDVSVLFLHEPGYFRVRFRSHTEILFRRGEIVMTKVRRQLRQNRRGVSAAGGPFLQAVNAERMAQIV